MYTSGTNVQTLLKLYFNELGMNHLKPKAESSHLIKQ